MDDEFKKQLLGVTTEVGGGIATDVATTPLLAMGPVSYTHLTLPTKA